MIILINTCHNRLQNNESNKPFQPSLDSFINRWNNIFSVISFINQNEWNKPINQPINQPINHQPRPLLYNSQWSIITISDKNQIVALIFFRRKMTPPLLPMPHPIVHDTINIHPRLLISTTTDMIKERMLIVINKTVLTCPHDYRCQWRVQDNHQIVMGGELRVLLIPFTMVWLGSKMMIWIK